jgi:hypothetical protein
MSADSLSTPPRGLSPPRPLPSRVASSKTDALLKPAQPQLLRPIRPVRSCHGVHAADDARVLGVNGEPPGGPEVNGCFARSDPCSCRGGAQRTTRAAPASTVSRWRAARAPIPASQPSRGVTAPALRASVGPSPTHRPLSLGVLAAVVIAASDEADSRRTPTRQPGADQGAPAVRTLH